MPTQRSDAQMKTYLEDSRRLLRLGQLRASDTWLTAELQKHGVSADELRIMIGSHVASLDSEEAFFESSVQKLTDMLHGDAEAAETFMVLDSLDCMADRIFENLHYQSLMQQNGTLSGEYAEQMTGDLQALRGQLSECITSLSGSSRVVVNTALDSYIANLKEELGLTRQIER